MSYQGGYQTEGQDSLVNDPLPTPPQPYSDNQIRGKKNLHTAFFIILIAIAAVAGFAAFLNFCLSMGQVSSQTSLANGTSIWEKETSSCSDVKAFLPLRWQIAFQPGVMFVCPWSPSNSGFRSFMSIVAMGVIGLFVVALKKPDHTIINWSFLGSCGFIALMFLIVTIVDGTSLSKANDYCARGMPEATALFKPGLMVNGTFGVACFSEPYTGTMFSDVFVFIAFPALAAYFFYYHRRSVKTGESTIPSDADETKPLAAEPPKKKMFVASEINDESLTQDVTGANPFDPKTGMVDPNSA